MAADSAARFCCFGCEAVHTSLRRLDLMRYYQLRSGQGAPVGELSLERRDHAWLEAYLASRPLDGAASAVLTHPLRVQGVRCAACVWLIETVFERSAHSLKIAINPSNGQLRLQVGAAFDLRAFVHQLESLGYLLGPAHQADPPTRVRDGLLLRLGICAALASNSMMFSAAAYFGLTQGPLHELLYRLNFAAVSLSVLVGGGLFIGSAARALRHGALHLDVPIALSIITSYAAACFAYVSGTERSAYFDSLSAFIALMLLGRYLQDRALARSRAELLSHDQALGLYSRRLVAGRVGVTPCSALRQDDVLIIAPGDLVPADALLLEAPALCSLDWIDGEAQPRTFEPGQTIPAGAFNTGMRALRVRLLHDFSGSALAALLLAGPQACSTARSWRFAHAYVGLVTVFAAGGGLYFTALGAGLSKGLEVMAAVAAVSCPCAIGLTVPLAYDWMHVLLRRRGVFVRSADLLDRVRSVRSVVFDKTGTLTHGGLRDQDAASLRALPLSDRQVIYDMVSRSLHPTSIAILRALAPQADKLEYQPALDVEEHVGQGLEARMGGRVYRLGRSSWAAPGGNGEVGYSVDGELRVELQTTEVLRPGAHEELQQLRALGYDVWLLSGDRAPRVREIAGQLSLPESRSGWEHSAECKRRLVQDQRTPVLMIGDGLNDAPAMRAAHCSGTPAIDRALMPARADFYFTQAGLVPVRMVLQAGQLLSRVVSTNVAFGVLYNGLAMTVAVVGAMRPWLAALLMPLSSSLLVLHTTARMVRWSRSWTS